MSTESELLERARAGDARAMEELLARHERSVYRFGLRMCGDTESAREVLQETLFAAFKGLGNYRGEATLSTWLYQIARSFCIKQRRTGQGEQRTYESATSKEALAVPVPQSSQDDRAHARQMATLIEAAMQSLPADAREVLVLRDVEGLSAEESAGVIGISVSAIKSRLHRARMELSQQLGAVLSAPQSVGCPELTVELSAYAADEVDQAMCARIEGHLERCQRCAATCDALKRTVSLCRALPGGDVPGPVKAAVRAALRASEAIR